VCGLTARAANVWPHLDCRVSTLGQTVENQIREIEVAGFAVEKRRLITETVSGSSAIEQRRGFMKLLVGECACHVRFCPNVVCKICTMCIRDASYVLHRSRWHVLRGGDQASVG
jgi:hypothetical protein